MANFANWRMEGDELREAFESSITVHGLVRVNAFLDAMTSDSCRYITLVLPLLDADGKPFNRVIAREAKVTGGGMDMSFALAYEMYRGIYKNDPSRPYQKYLDVHWI